MREGSHGKNQRKAVSGTGRAVQRAGGGKKSGMFEKTPNEAGVACGCCVASWEVDSPDAGRELGR